MKPPSKEMLTLVRDVGAIYKSVLFDGFGFDAAFIEAREMSLGGAPFTKWKLLCRGGLLVLSQLTLDERHDEMWAVIRL